MNTYNNLRAEKYRATEAKIETQKFLYCLEDEYGVLYAEDADKEKVLKLLRLAIEKKADGLRDSVAEKLQAYSSYGDAYSDERARVAFFHAQEKRVDDAATEEAKACFTFYKKIILDFEKEGV
jgi:hypothetical protein